MIVTNLVEIYPIENDIIYIKVINGVDFTAEELLNVFQMLEEMAGGKPYVTLTDARDINVGHITMDAFKVTSGKQHNPNQLAEAYLCDSLHIRLLINFYFKVCKPVIPFKMFQCADEAKKWLREIQAKELRLV